MVFGKLFGDKDKAAPKPLPQIGDAAFGRALQLDPMMLAAIAAETGAPCSPDFLICAQGLAVLEDASGSSYIHRFYDEEDRLLQVMTSDPDGGVPEEWSFYLPAGSEYLSIGEKVSDWTQRLTKPTTTFADETFERLWYEGDPEDHPPVRFSETVWAKPDRSEETTIVQECMMYGRERAEGEVLLLDLIMETNGEVSFERMIGTGLRDHHISI